MKKTLLFILLLLILPGACPALGYEILVVKSGGESPVEQVISAFSEKLGRLLPARGVKSIEPLRFSEIDLIAGPSKSAVEREVREARPDLILALGRDALLAVRDLSDIPVIFLLVVDPAAIIENRANITGINLEIPPRLQFDELSRLLPQVRRIGAIYHSERSLAEIRAACRCRPDLEFVPLEAGSAREVPARLEELRGRVDLIWLLPDQVASSPQILESYFLFSFTNRVPVLAFSEKYLKSGAAVVVTFDLEAMGEQAAVMADRILQGAPVGAVPRADISRVKTIVNTTVARKLLLNLAEKAPQ